MYACKLCYSANVLVGEPDSELAGEVEELLLISSIRKFCGMVLLRCAGGAAGLLTDEITRKEDGEEEVEVE